MKTGRILKETPSSAMSAPAARNPAVSTTYHWGSIQSANRIVTAMKAASVTAGSNKSPASPAE